MSSDEPIFRVIFQQQGKSYEIYARYLTEESLIGFIEFEELLFSEGEGTVVVDPSEERLRQEFKGVRRTYVPIHLITRIDEVQQEGTAKIKELGEASNVSPFPGSYQYLRRDDEE